MAQDYRITIAIAKHKRKAKQNASKEPNSATPNKIDYEKWMHKQLTQNKPK